MNEATAACWVYVTFPDVDTAREIARAAVTARRAACANILPAHDSIYEWEGKLSEEPEIATVFKTTNAAYPALESFILERHPYATPCIVALPIQQGYGPYLEWLATQTTA